MKLSTLKLAILLLTTLFLLPACSNSDDDLLSVPGIDSTIPEFGTISAKINGQNYSSTVGNGVIVDVIGHKQFMITGLTDPGNPMSAGLWVALYVPESLTLEATSYEFEGACEEMEIEICGWVGYVSNEQSENYTSTNHDTNCTITFSSIDFQHGGHAKGTFSGEIVNETGVYQTVTDGQFEVEILPQ